jgi:hypothetical protein
MMTADNNVELRTVTMQGCPLELLHRARQHAEALLRELAFIVDGGGDNTELPKRFLAVVKHVRDRAGGLNTGAERAIDEALARGDASIDFEVVMPTALGRGAPAFAALLDEIDAYCRSGDLLTLETTGDVRAFQRWYLGEMASQLDGAGPTPWHAWRPTEAAGGPTRS